MSTQVDTLAAPRLDNAVLGPAAWYYVHLRMNVNLNIVCDARTRRLEPGTTLLFSVNRFHPYRCGASHYSVAVALPPRDMYECSARFMS